MDWTWTSLVVTGMSLPGTLVGTSLPKAET